jgi:hypothetical protein
MAMKSASGSSEIMSDIFDRFENRFDDMMENFENWVDRVTEFDFRPQINSEARAPRNLRLKLRTPIPAHHRLPEEFIAALEAQGVDLDAIHAALRNHLPAGTLLEIRQHNTKLRIEIEGYHDL